MMHRKIYEENRNLGFIIVKNLDLSKFKDEVEKLISISTGEDKLLFITTYIENNIKPIDIFSNLMFYNETEEINDLVKFYLIYALSLLNKNLMKKYFTNIDIKENNLIVSKDNPLFMSKNLFQILFSLLYHCKEKEVEHTIYELLLEYSEMSNDFTEHCLEDTRYIGKIFQLTYANFNEIINNSLIILDNILCDRNCDSKQLENILQEYSIIERCKELLLNNNLEIESKINCLEILVTISQKLENYLDNYFFDFINIFYNILVLQKQNEEIFMNILKICEAITKSDNICLKIKEVGLIDIFYNSLSQPNIERDFLIKLLNIFSDLFYEDEIVNYYIIDKNAQIINVFIKIINTYMHTCNDKDDKLLAKVFYCLSNIAAGTQDPNVQYIFSKSEIPKLVIQIMKIKNNNDINYEGVQILNNLITDCNKETFYNVSELQPFKIYAKALNDTSKADKITFYLKAIIKLIENNNKFYHTLENLKKEFYICLIKKKIDDLTYHSDKKISLLAKKIIENLEDKMKMDD